MRLQYHKNIYLRTFRCYLSLKWFEMNYCNEYFLINIFVHGIIWFSDSFILWDFITMLHSNIYVITIFYKIILFFKLRNITCIILLFFFTFSQHFFPKFYMIVTFLIVKVTLTQGVKTYWANVVCIVLYEAQLTLLMFCLHQSLDPTIDLNIFYCITFSWEIILKWDEFNTFL